MSYPSSSSSNGVASNQSGRYTVAPQAIQSVIADHRNPFVGFTTPLTVIVDKAPRGSEPAQFQMALKAAGEAHSSGKISQSEFSATCRRIIDDMAAYRRRTADYDAREQAGLTKPGDFFKEFYGYTDEEVEEFVRRERNLENIERANAARNQSRMLHRSRHGRGH